MKKAIDYVTEEVFYDRPHYDFPDLSSENGNPIFYWKDAINKLQRQGFKAEAEEIILYHSEPRVNSGGYIFPKMGYHEQFNFLNKFLEFNPKEEKVNEDDEYVYLKIKKTSYKDGASLKQPTLFFANNKDMLEEMLSVDEDFTITNCYKRNIFHYCTNPQALEYLLEKNKEHKWINLFSLDRFNSTVLHTHSNLTSFSILLKAMYEQNPELTKIYFLNYNIFDRSASGVYLSMLDRHITNKALSIDSWTEFLRSTQVVKLVNIDIYNDIINAVYNLPFFKNIRDNEEQYKNINIDMNTDTYEYKERQKQREMYQLYTYMMMDFNLNTKEVENKPTRRKI